MPPVVQRARLGAPKAITATAHKLGRIVYHRMRGGVAYLNRAEELGYEVKKIGPVDPTESSDPALVS